MVNLRINCEDNPPNPPYQGGIEALELIDIFCEDNPPNPPYQGDTFFARITPLTPLIRGELRYLLMSIYFYNLP